MKKMLFLLLGLLLVSGTAQARDLNRKSKVYVPVTDMMAGDHITRILAADPTDNTIPWFKKDLARTVIVMSTVADVTATAVTFDFEIPNDYLSGGEMYALIKPGAAAFTFTLTADTQIQNNITSNPTTVTAVVTGTTPTAATVPAAALDNLTMYKLVTTQFDNATNPEPNSLCSVLLKRASGTAQDVFLHGFYFVYEPHIFRSR